MFKISFLSLPFIFFAFSHNCAFVIKEITSLNISNVSLETETETANTVLEHVTIDELPPFFGFDLKRGAHKINQQLQEIVNVEMGLYEFQENIDSFQYNEVLFNLHGDLDEMTKKLKNKVTKYLKFLAQNVKRIQELHVIHEESPLAFIHPCYTLTSDKFRYEEDFGIEVNLESTCDLLPPFPVLSKEMFMPGPNLSETFQKTYFQNPSIKWQYFISSTTNIHTQFPAISKVVDEWGKKHFKRHEQVYISTLFPQRKTVIIMIDHGKSLSEHQLEMAKAISKHILSFLTIHDMVGVFGIGAHLNFPSLKKCNIPPIGPASVDNKLRFSRFIDNLTISNNHTDHNLGMLSSFELLHNSINFKDLDNEVLIAYVSRGLLMSLKDARPIMETIANYNSKLLNKVIINTFILKEEGKPLMYEEIFLKDIAHQNFTKYNITDMSPELPTPKKGRVIVINSTENLGRTMFQFFSSLGTQQHSNISFSLPSWEPNDKQLALMSISVPILQNEKLLGVAGLDVEIEEFVDDLAFYGQNTGNYAFLVDVSGIVLVHPLLQNNPYTHLTDISHLEDRRGFNQIRNTILKDKFGHRQIASLKLKNNKTNEYEKVLIVYFWKRVPGTQYILCIVSEDTNTNYNELYKVNYNLQNKLIYHRLDLGSKENLCRFFKSMSTLESATIFLSSRSFTAPYKFLTADESRIAVQSYLTYFKDTLKLLANPGLKPEIRNQVLALSTMTSYWMSSNQARFVVRRYVASRSGVMVMYPGMFLDKTYDPTTREWFTRALANPGQVILSAPYLDWGGAGYIITISQTVYEGRSNSQHSTSDRVFAVLAIDLPLGYYQKLVYESLSICRENKVICFLMDERGYLLFHPGLLTGSKGPLEHQHITHKEPLVSCDLLNNKYFFEKKLCYNFQDSTIQRFYQVNTSFEDVLINQVPGETCAKYQVTKIPRTNIFLAIVNQTCEAVTAFCPCSLIDRLCLNCQRMEQTECECPCECPMDVCPKENQEMPSCPKYLKSPPIQLSEIPSNLDLLPDCFKSECGNHLKDTFCLGIVGCEWCHKDRDGLTPLPEGFCTEQFECFGGVLGARSPYADEIIGSPENSAKSTPVGPVAGGIMAIFLSAAIGIICYRHLSPRSQSLLASHSPAPQRRGGNEHDEIAPYEDNVGPAAPHNLRLLDLERISPYRVNPGYRRPPVTESSDHGYSTMTPHEDSEHLSAVEPLIEQPPSSFIKVVPSIQPTTSFKEIPPINSQIQVQIHSEAF